MSKQNKNSLKKKKKNDSWMAYLFVLPSFVLFAMFCYYPLGKTIMDSFSVTSATGDFIRWNGLANWKRVFEDVNFGLYMGNTFKFAVYNLLMTFFPALFLAMLSTRKEKGSKLYQTFYAMPLAIAATSVAAIWRFIFSQDGGILNQVLGTNEAWLLDTKMALFFVAIVSSWSHIAGRYIYLMVGFRNVSDDLIEAATIDGAGWWTRMIRILIPMASPQIFFVLFTSIVSAFKTFTQIKLMTNGGPAGSTTTLMYWLFTKYSASQISACACVALILFLVIFIVSRIQFLFEKKLVFYQ